MRTCAMCLLPAVIRLIVDSDEGGHVETEWCQAHGDEAKRGLSTRIALGQQIAVEVEELPEFEYLAGGRGRCSRCQTVTWWSNLMHQGCVGCSDVSTGN